MDDTTRIMAVTGAVLAVVAAVAWLGDRRRHRRSDLDRVGWMPWTALFFWSLLGAVVLLGVAGRAMVG